MKKLRKKILGKKNFFWGGVSGGYLAPPVPKFFKGIYHDSPFILIRCNFLENFRKSQWTEFELFMKNPQIGSFWTIFQVFLAPNPHF